MYISFSLSEWSWLDLESFVQTTVTWDLKTEEQLILFWVVGHRFAKVRCPCWSSTSPKYSIHYIGFGDRLLNEVKKVAVKDVKLKIYAPPERKYSTWIGGSILAGLNTFKKVCMSLSYTRSSFLIIDRCGSLRKSIKKTRISSIKSSGFDRVTRWLVCSMWHTHHLPPAHYLGYPHLMTSFSEGSFTLLWSVVIGHRYSA